jgi:hypothetical protein
MFDLIETELRRVRRMGEEADDAFLAYLIDMAIMQANKRACSSNDNPETLVTESPQHDPSQRAERS